MQRKSQNMDSKTKMAFVHRDISKSSFSNRDYGSAKKFALEAQMLNPEVPGLSDMIQALDVFVSTDNKVGKEVDRYKVLRVRPRDDEATIHKSFKDLAVTVHPDRNKSEAAGGAFRIVTEAWGLLKHAEMRALYDEDRRKKAARASASSYSGRLTFLPRPTFWTACPGCKFQFEYPRGFVDKTLECLKCRKPFFSVEIKLPIAPTNVQAYVVGLFEPEPEPEHLGPRRVGEIPSARGGLVVDRAGPSVPNVGPGRLGIPSDGAGPSARPSNVGEPKTGAGSAPEVGPGRVEASSGGGSSSQSVRAGPSVSRFVANGAGTSTGEGGESRKRKKSAAAQKPEAKGRTQDGLLKKLTELQRREMLMSKAKTAVLKHIFPK